MSRLSSILRIDVNQKLDGLEYGIPQDNPFANGILGAPEVFSKGFRNPYRFSFDNETGLIWVADPGQVRWDEVSVVRRGGLNFGWRLLEGCECFNPTNDCDSNATTELPVFEIDNYSGFVTCLPSLQLFSSWKEKLTS